MRFFHMDKQPRSNKKMKLLAISALMVVIGALGWLTVKSLRKPTPVTSATPVSSPRPAPTPPRANPVLTNPREGAQSVIKEIVFESLSCRAARKTVVCDLTVKNESSTEQKIMLIHFDDSTKIFDELGNGYPAFGINFGDKASGGRLKLVSLAISPNVITKAAITFDNVSYGAETISLLRIKGGIGTLGRDFRGFYVSFKNIAIIR
jgi:hypothetical protein